MPGRETETRWASVSVSLSAGKGGGQEDSRIFPAETARKMSQSPACAVIGRRVGPVRSLSGKERM